MLIIFFSRYVQIRNKVAIQAITQACCCQRSPSQYHFKTDAAPSCTLHLHAPFIVAHNLSSYPGLPLAGKPPLRQRCRLLTHAAPPHFANVRTRQATYHLKFPQSSSSQEATPMLTKTMCTFSHLAMTTVILPRARPPPFGGAT